jgi:hypothetical protein
MNINPDFWNRMTEADCSQFPKPKKRERRLNCQVGKTITGGIKTNPIDYFV